MFPTEESLLSVDPFMEDLRAKITTLDKEIMDTVRLQTTGSASAQHELEGGKAAVQELFQRVQQIKSKAADSEAMVAEICRDIKSLDHAKRNLTVTITALKRLQMLSSAVQQLAAMTESRRYREAAHLLGAVNQLAVNFEGYRGIAKVDDLVRTIDGIKSDLRKRIFDDVNRLSTGGGQEDGAGGGGGGGGDAGPEGAAAGPGSIDHLADACAAVDALGEGVRREMLTWFCNLQFAFYRHTFQPYGEAGSLEKTELRYTWLRRTLKVYQERCAPRPGHGVGGTAGDAADVPRGPAQLRKRVPRRVACAVRAHRGVLQDHAGPPPGDAPGNQKGRELASGGPHPGPDQDDGL